MSGRLAPSDAISGCVKSVQTYCGLAMATIEMTPRISCVHRERAGSGVTRSEHGLGNRRAVLARVRRAGIDLRAFVPHHGLAAAHHVREVALQLDLVAAARQRVADLCRESRLQHDVEAVEGELC